MGKFIFIKKVTKLLAKGDTAVITVNQNGQPFGWGNGANGQLGDNSVVTKNSPVSLAVRRLFSQVENGTNFSAGLEHDTGFTFCWGLNTSGQLGNNTVTQAQSPVSVVGGKRFVDISAGAATVSALDSFGNAWSWGSAANGALGDGITSSNLVTAANRSSPVSVAVARSYSYLFLDSSSYALEASTGNAYAWGGGTNGQLGLNASVGVSFPNSVVGGRSFRYIVNNGSQTFAIEGSTGNVYSWGAAGSGILGDNTSANRSSPTSVVGGRSFSIIISNGSTAYAIEASTGNAYAWGSNSFGAIGDNTTANRSSPTSVVGGRSYSAISSDGSAVHAIEGSTGRAYAWGRASNGFLGDNTIINKSSPVSVLGGRSFRAIFSTSNFVNAIEGSTGNVYSWGASTGIGDNANASRSSPVSVAGARSFSTLRNNSLNNVIALEASTGNLYTWGGTNTQGQLGDNSVANRSSPTSVVGGRSFSGIAVFYTSVLAIEGSTGNAYTWGSNTLGAIGDNTAANRSSPTSVLGARSFRNLTTGRGTSTPALIEGSTGNIFAWGSGTGGTVGDSIQINRSSPISVIGAKSFKQISVGPNVVAIDLDNFAYTWGLGTSGQLGNNAIASVNSPVSVFGAKTFKQVVVGSSGSTCYGIELSTGRAYSWGAGALGQIGDNTINDRSSPTSVVGARSFRTISAGPSFAAGIEASTGLIWTWGANTGNLGTGTVSSSSSPVSVLGGRSFASLSCFNNGMLAIEASTNTLYAWGQLGSSQFAGTSYSDSGSPISVIGGRSVSQVFGATSNIFFSEASTGFAWASGFNSTGVLGDNTSGGDTSSPVSVVGARSFSRIVSNATPTTVAIDGATGRAWAWGAGSSGQIGNNTINDRSSPTSVLGARSFSVIEMSYLTSPIVAGIVGNNGRAFTWGINTNGVLGNNTVASASSPVSVLGARSFSQIKVITPDVLGIRPYMVAIEGGTGNAYAWGTNTTSSVSGLLGDNTITNRSSPVSVVGGRSFSTLVGDSGTSSSAFVVALEGSTGNAYAWGGTLNGSLGDNTLNNRSSPTSVVGGRSFSFITTNQNSAVFGIDGSNGRAYAWGSAPSFGNNGILGNNNNNSSQSPASVLGGRSFRVISSYQNTALAIEGSTGNAYAWGANASGQLGDGTTIERSSPVSVLGGRSYSTIYSYDSYSVAIEASTGLAYIWGGFSSASGYLAQNVKLPATSPIQIMQVKNL